MTFKNPLLLLMCLAFLSACLGSDPYHGKTDTPAVPDNPSKPDNGEQQPTVTFESAATAVLNMGAGWNLGNTLDSNSGSTDHMWIEAYTSRTPKDYETAWGQPQATRELIHMFKEAGFGAIRVPVTWYPHMGKIVLHDTEKWDQSTWSGTDVDPVWMARVKEVVDYVIDEGLYCILNVHHDTGDRGEGNLGCAWLVADRFDDAKARYEALWKQIATQFKDYGDHLLFESYNEMLDSWNSWCFASFASPSRYDASGARAAYNGINNYARLFVETVRATGSNNSVRNLVINTYGACSGDGNWNQHLTEPLSSMQIPEAPGHIAVQVHSYWESDKFDASMQRDIDKLFSNLDTHIVKRLGVPAIIGEWGGGVGTDTDKNVAFAGYFTAAARKAGVATFWWMGLSDGKDREAPAWTMPLTKDAILSSYK